jgi:hypothetical protein
MKTRLRYVSALIVNIALPWLAYRLAYPCWGHPGALAASALPLLAWMAVDFLRYRHVDALSALVLASIVLALITVSAGGDTYMKEAEDPMISGMIGVAFLVTLALPRPMVFYLARSTMSREDPRGARLFDRHWGERPVLVAYVRLMTLVWGVGMTGENILRSVIVWHWPNDPRSALASVALRWGVYGVLMLWTFWCRRRIKQDALRYPDDPVAPEAFVGS